MTPGIKPLVAGNWKMNGLQSSLAELSSIVSGYNNEMRELNDLLVCVPFTLLIPASEMAEKSGASIGGQDCHANASGAHTGDISAAMIADCGASAVIVGHSERRTDHQETDDIVLGKAKAGLAEGLQTIVCIGETEAERKSGETLNVLKRQLSGSVPDGWEKGELVIAYEPVWAIGTGLVPTVSDIQEAHEFMRSQLVGRFGEKGAKIRILYGGSVKPSNAADLMAIENVDGALVGGASLKAPDFLGICAAYS